METMLFTNKKTIIIIHAPQNLKNACVLKRNDKWLFKHRISDTISFVFVYLSRFKTLLSLIHSFFNL